MNKSELKEFLDEKVELYNRPDFIESDPVQIPHRFGLKEDIVIAPGVSSTIISTPAALSKALMFLPSFRQ